MARLRVADVALFYGERSGGIRTYLDAKAKYARRTGALEHHVLVPGPEERHDAGWHELRSLRLAASNGYRLPLGAGPLRDTLRAIEPDVVLLHDPFWRPLRVTHTAQRFGARVLAVHHASIDLDAAGLPGPTRLYRPLLHAWFHHAYRELDGVISVVDPEPDSGRSASMPLRLGLDPAFRPYDDVRRGEHVLYVGRLGRERVSTWSSLAPLALPSLPEAIRRRLVEQHLLHPARYAAHTGIPSVAIEEPSFRPGFDRYRCWRGPSWMNAAWLLVPPMRELGYETEADRIVGSLASAVERSGFREYYNPLTGTGLGARGFGFSTLLIDLLDLPGDPADGALRRATAEG